MDSVHETAFREPGAGQVAASSVVKPQPSGYQRYMAREEIPIYDGPGFRDVRELELGWWERRGCEGAFLTLDQVTHQLGLNVLRIPPGGATRPDGHIYEERYWVIEGEGSTELWQPGSDKHYRFEWQAGALFSIPLNMRYQIVNGGNTPVVLLAGNYAPRILDMYDNFDFVFANDFVFSDRFDGSDDYFVPNLQAVANREVGRALWRTSVIPDIVDCELPLDNLRSPGYRRIELNMSAGKFWGFVGEHQSGRYSTAHYHPAAAVLVCLKGEGYTYAWPNSLGTTPWADGHGDQVERVDYGPGGLVAAAPGNGEWFHQHFTTGADPMRMLQFYGGQPGGMYYNYEGRRARKVFGGEVGKGGNQIPYRLEDPHVRQEYRRMLELAGVPFNMPDPE